MLHLVIGGSGSGKSAYAEKRCLEYGGPCLYLATMKIWDEEDRKRVEKHRAMRAGKGFETWECPVDLEMLDLPERFRNGTVLLECMSNLLVNELWREDKKKDGQADGENDIAGRAARDQDTETRILRGIRHLADCCGHLVIVTDDIFSDGIRYDEETVRYLRILAALNRDIAEQADTVTEVVFGIPVPVKGMNGRKEYV
ncbi:bifunctional adenosylcobinamide kinase/adenosylcobinamide-phosphate guanylyltransferase [[Clostridium] aminophilum]|uniref:bifunctional adenosylcobinamide kinase/adenosylcobinamide-phosphate guanylyltransferase n=1 Tax=[Clostridium] aminophilum TaxID=1526 RepID=UPI003316F02F